jgi:hypothetical protein
MSEEQKSGLESVLFPSGIDEQNRSALLEQYKLLVQTSETLVGRRQTVNTFFLSINSLLLAAIGLFAKEGIPGPLTGFGVLALGIAGLVLCVAWRRLVHSYRQLNAGKFEVIHLLEKHLPASVFKAEWEALGAGRDKGKYQPFTRTEAAIPWVFGILYVVAVAGSVYMLFGVAGK